MFVDIAMVDPELCAQVLSRQLFHFDLDGRTPNDQFLSRLEITGHRNKVGSRYHRSMGDIVAWSISFRCIERACLGRAPKAATP